MANKRGPVNKIGIPIDKLVALTVQQAADLLGIQRPTLYQFIRSGQLRSYRIGRRRLISRSALDRFQAEMEEAHIEALTANPFEGVAA